MRVLSSFLKVTTLSPIIYKTQNNYSDLDIVFCKYNSDCLIPKVCCQMLSFNYCCIPENLKPCPIPVPNN